MSFGCSWHTQDTYYLNFTHHLLVWNLSSFSVNHYNSIVICPIAIANTIQWCSTCRIRTVVSMNYIFHNNWHCDWPCTGWYLVFKNSVPAIQFFILWLLWSPSIVRLFVVCNCQAEPGADLSYGDVGYHAYGNFGRVLVEWAIILSQTGNYLYSQCKISMVLIPTLYMHATFESFWILLPHEIQRLLMQAIIWTHYFTGLSQVVSIKTPMWNLCFQ